MSIAPLIGFGGRKESGKDTAADFLVAERGYVKLGMSEGLHNCLLALNPLVPVTEEDARNILARTGVGAVSGWFRYAELFMALGYVNMKIVAEVRRLQQAMGTEVGRVLLGENVWVHMAADAIFGLRAAGTPVTITGIRYPNEIEMIRDLGGLSVWIERPGLDATDQHTSERSLTRDDFDTVIFNDSSLAVLRYRTLLLTDDWASAVAAQDVELAEALEELEPWSPAETCGEPEDG